MKYQLVLQLPYSEIRDYDAMIAIEEVIIKNIGSLGKVDGHDAGSGEMNIFIHTDHPKLAFEQICRIIGSKDFMADMKVAYREFNSDTYTILFPPDLSHFEVI